MITFAGVDFKGKEELTLFAFFAEATTLENNVEKPYASGECRGVVGQLIQREKPGFLDSPAYKKLNVRKVRNKWLNKPNHPDVIRLRRKFAEDKDYYLARALELFEEYQNRISSSRPEKSSSRPQKSSSRPEKIP